MFSQEGNIIQCKKNCITQEKKFLQNPITWKVYGDSFITQIYTIQQAFWYFPAPSLCPVLV